MMLGVGFCSPKTLGEALIALANGQSRPLAGGTDLLPAIRAGKIAVSQLVDLSQLQDLRFIDASLSLVEIGALTTYQDIIESEALAGCCALIVEAARMVGAQQTRNRGTVGGCLGNASPASDLVPPLLTLNAEVSLVTAQGQRQTPLESFLLAPGKTSLAYGEIIHHVRFAPPPRQMKSAFVKLGRRAGMSCAIANLALVVQLASDSSIADLRVAVGAVGPTAIRCRETESILTGRALTLESIKQASEAISRECSPIDDIRGTARYRRHAVGRLLERGLREALGGVP